MRFSPYVHTFLMHCSTRQFLFITILVGFVLIRETGVAPFNKAEGAFATWLQAYAPQPAPAQVALVGISDEDLYVSRWPWQPVDYSLFLNATLPFQPSVLAIEPVLAWEKADGKETLHNQVLRAPKLLLAAELGPSEDPALVQPLQEAPVLRHVEGNATGFRQFPVITAQPGDELGHSAALGFFGPGLQGTSISRVPLVYRYCGQVVPSFVLQAAMLWYGVTAEEVRVIAGSHVELGQAARVPIDSAGTMAVNFAIPTARFSFPDVILSAEQHQEGHATAIPAGQLKNALVLLARTDGGARTLPLANGRLGSRGELAAAAIATIQQQRFAHPAPLAASFAVLALALPLGWTVNRLSRLGAAVICIGAFALYLLVSLGIFTSWQVALPFGLPAGLCAFLFLFRQVE